MNASDAKTIREWLARLIGLKLSAAWRAADMRVFHLGTMTDCGQGSVGEFALHIQCPWRINNRDGIVTGRSDLWEPIDRPDGFSYDHWDYERDGNLQDKLLNEMIDRSAELYVESVEVHTNGSFTIALSDHHRLLVFPAGSDGEDWRLFRPGSTQKGDHLVISGGERRQHFDRVFQQKFVEGFRRLVRRGKLRLEGAWARLLDPPQLKAWLAKVTESDWNVFIEGPPHGNSHPQQVLMYLTRYLTGGPISDSRIVRDDGGKVTFLARSKDKQAGNPRREVELPGHEFLRRWSLHILPKGYTKSRCYGGYHGTKRQAYLQQCRRLLPKVETPDEDQSATRTFSGDQSSLPKCRRCNVEMICIEAKTRPSWKDVFNRRSYCSHCTTLPVHGKGGHYVPDD